MIAGFVPVFQYFFMLGKLLMYQCESICQGEEVAEEDKKIAFFWGAQALFW